MFCLRNVTGRSDLIRNPQPCHLVSFMSACLQCTADGPGSDRVPKLAAAGLKAELATTLRLQIVARIVSAMQATRATCEFAQVRLVWVWSPAWM